MEGLSITGGGIECLCGDYYLSSDEHLSIRALFATCCGACSDMESYACAVTMKIKPNQDLE